MTNTNNDASGNAPATKGQSTDVTDITRRFNALIKDTKRAICVERLWPKTVPPFCTTSLFLSSVWLGLWTPLPASARIAGVLTFAAVAIASPLMARTGNLRVTRQDAIRRLDKDLGNPKAMPARNLDDKVSDNAPEIQKELHDKKIAKIWEEWGEQLKPAKPAFNAPGQGRYKASLAAALCLAVAAGTIAGDNRMERLREVFNKAPAAAVSPLKVIAWTTPPRNIDGELYLDNNTRDHTQGGKELATSQYSTMTIHVYDKLAKVLINDKELPVDETFLTKDGKNGEKTVYQYETELIDENTVISIENGPTWHIHVQPDRPPAVDIENISPNTENENTLDVIYRTKDDHGIEGGKITIEPAEKDPDARPLPSSKLPVLPLP